MCGRAFTRRTGAPLHRTLKSWTRTRQVGANPHRAAKPIFVLLGELTQDAQNAGFWSAACCLVPVGVGSLQQISKLLLSSLEIGSSMSTEMSVPQSRQLNSSTRPVQEYIEREDEFDINPRPAEESGHAGTAGSDDDLDVDVETVEPDLDADWSSDEGPAGGEAPLKHLPICIERRVSPPPAQPPEECAPWPALTLFQILLPYI